MILLDTITLVWAAMDDPALGKRSRALVNKEVDLRVCPITFWEIGMLIDKDRLDLGERPSIWIEAILTEAQIGVAAIEPAIGIDAGRLPGTIHGDPADRLIIATARALDCPLLTPDEKILAYAKSGHLQVIDARR